MSQAPTTREYDTFGPWISRVTSREDLPRLYASYPLDPASADLVLKVPREISRRDATPHMDLYDHVLCVADAQLTVLSRLTERGRERRPDDGPGFTATVLPIGDIASIHDSLHLLDGRLEVKSRSGSGLHVPYNGSARDTVDQLISLLKSVIHGPPTPTARSIMAAAPVPPLALKELAPGEEDVVFISDAMELIKGAPNVQLWTCHGRIHSLRLAKDRTSTIQRLARRVSPLTLSGAVVAADALALEVITRKQWLRKARLPEYSHGRIVVPWAGLDGVDVVPHAIFDGVMSVTLTSGLSVTELLVPASSDAAELLMNAAR